MSVRRGVALFACAAFCAAAVGGLSGCSTFAGPGETWRSMKEAFTIRNDNRRNSTEEKDEQWRGVADEGRRGQEVEHDVDQWYRKYFMSEKAREIERNFGIE